MGVSISGAIRYLTQVGRGGHRPDVALVEPLILEFGHPIKTRRSNGKVAPIGLSAITQLKNQDIHKGHRDRPSEIPSRVREAD